MAQNHHLGVLLVSLNPSIRAVSRRGTTAEALLLLPQTKPQAGRAAPRDPQPLTMLFQRVKARTVGSWSGRSP